jgi:chorismate mutase/prephenate dehydratase
LGEMSKPPWDTANLDRLRERIDELDNQILRLLNERMLRVKQIAVLKRQAGKDPLDISREQAIFRRLARDNRGPLPWGAVKKIFGEILAASRDIQSGPGKNEQRPLSGGGSGPESQ